MLMLAVLYAAVLTLNAKMELGIAKIAKVYGKKFSILQPMSPAVKDFYKEKFGMWDYCVKTISLV